MARSRKSKSRKSDRQRDNKYISNRRIAEEVHRLRKRDIMAERVAQVDTRRYRPGLSDQLVRLRRTWRKAHKPLGRFDVITNISRKFDVALRWRACRRRAIRKMVLHALDKVGKGSGGGRKRITWRSRIKC